MQERGIGQHRNQDQGDKDLENQQEIFLEQPPKPLPNRPLFHDPLPEKEGGCPYFKTLRPEAMKKDNPRNNSQEEEKGERKPPEHFYLTLLTWRRVRRTKSSKGIFVGGRR